MLYFPLVGVIGLFVLFALGCVQGSIPLLYVLVGFLLCAFLVLPKVMRKTNAQRVLDTNTDDNPLLSNSFSDVSKAVTHATSKMAMGAAEVSHFVDTLSKDIHLTRDDSEQIQQAVGILSVTGLTLSKNLGQLAHTMSDTAESSRTAQSALSHSAEQIGELTEKVQTASEQLALLTKSADDIDRITSVIKAVSEQTNLLALNAAIEAARAGEQGRGFAVVADEVRALAAKSANASEQISSLLTDVRRNSELTNHEMASLKSLTESLSSTLLGETQRFMTLTEDVQNASVVLSEVESAGEELGATSAQINGSISRISDSLREISQRSDRLSQEASGLSNGAEVVFRELDKVD